MGFKINMEFFNNKRLLVMLSGVACVMLALVIFVVSLIGMDNLSSFVFGAKNSYEVTNTPPAGTTTAPAQMTTAPAGTSTANMSTETPGGPTDNQTTEPQQQTTAPATQPPTTAAVSTTQSPQPTDKAVKTVKIDQGSTAEITVGQTLQLTTTVSPIDAANKKISWTCSPDGVYATVNSNGLVVPIAEGTVSVKATAEGGAWAQITVKIKAKSVSVEDVVISSKATKINVGDTLDLEAVIYPSTATNQNVKWSSSNTNIATVAGITGNPLKGRVTAKQEGTVTIKATVDGKSKEIEITVVKPDETEPPTG